jgi:hypothetical protein
MTRTHFVNMIAIAESNDKPKAFGDHGLAGGRFQMHWDWRADYWPEWAWEALALLDRCALEWFIVRDRTGKPRPPSTARQLADLFNLGHPAPDQAYDIRCLTALEALGVVQEEFDTVVE